MNRLHKKCLIGSLVVHGVSLLVLLVGPALMPKEKPLAIETFEIIDLANISLTDGQTTGGGAPAPPVLANPEPLPPIQQPVVQTPPPQPEPEPAPPVVKPQPKPVREPEPEPVKPVVKDKEPSIPKDPPKNPKPKPETKPKESAKETPTNKPKLNTKDQIKVNLTSTKRDAASKDAAAADDDKKRSQLLAQTVARQNALAGAARSIAGGLSTSTTISIPGTGSAAFVNYGQAVVSIYESRWTIPANLAGGNNVVRAKVVIRKDGTVISADIVDKSGNAGVNQSVQRVLDAVRFIKAFPPGATDAQRIFYINFDPNKKRSSG